MQSTSWTGSSTCENPSPTPMEAGTRNELLAAPAKPVDTVLETRLSGFTIHALVLATLPFASSLRVVPIAVVNGVFLYLGKKVMTGNQFLLRVRALAVVRGGRRQARREREEGEHFSTSVTGCQQ